MQGQPGLQNMFQDSQGYIVKPCLEKQKAIKQKRAGYTQCRSKIYFVCCGCGLCMCNCRACGGQKIRSPGLGITGSSELPSVGAGNQTRASGRAISGRYRGSYWVLMSLTLGCSFDFQKIHCVAITKTNSSTSFQAPSCSIIRN